MKIGFVVNDIDTEQAQYTTTRLALAATQMGHEAWYMGVGDFAYEPDGSLSAQGPHRRRQEYKSLERLPRRRPEAGGRAAPRLDELDVVMLRNDPADDAVDRPVAQQRRGGLRSADRLDRRARGQRPDQPGQRAVNKAYFQHFPEVVRPRTLISRDEKMIEDFVADLGGKAVLKPLQGSGGAGVFLVDRQGGAQPQPDHRGDLPRRLRRRAGVPARGRRTATCGCS